MIAPKKIYLETTTRCNLRCEKCIKQIKDNEICEGDMPYEVFEKILPELLSVDQLVLNGIGEPLLHPDLEKMIEAARTVMGEKSSIGFQTNGLLMTAGRAKGLVQSGLSTICFSLDSLAESEVNGSCDTRPSAYHVSRGLQHIQEAAESLDTHLTCGLEVVVSSNNIEELPDMVAWGAEHGIDYILVSHLFPYDDNMLEKSLFSTHSETAHSVFRKWQTKAKNLGIELCPEGKAYLGFSRTSKQKMTLDLIKGMYKEAAAENIRMHGETLLSYQPDLASQAEIIFDLARAIAIKGGITISLPPLAARDQRQCPFMDEKAAFISFQGEVMPCHFLWHTYPCIAGTETIKVQKRSFGHILSENFSDIWLSEKYIQFREEAASDEYSPCWNCAQGPCDDLVISNMLEIDDCYGSRVPCGHCLWSLGGLKCL